MFEHDRTKWQIQRICSSPKEYNGVEVIIVANFEKINELYRYLQTWSRRYPLITFSALRKKFYQVSMFHGKKNTQFSRGYEVFDAAVSQASFNKDVTADHHGALNRHQFIEFNVLLAKHIFMKNYQDNDDRNIDMKY